MTPKQGQGEDIKSYSPSSRLNPQLPSKLLGASTATAASGHGETGISMQPYLRVLTYTIIDIRIHKTHSGNTDGFSGRQPSIAQTRNPIGKNDQISLDSGWYDRGSTQSKSKMQYKGNSVEGIVDAEMPSLGFFTRTFSTALSRAADEQVLGTPQVEPTASRNRPTLGVNTSQLETTERPAGYLPSIGKGYENSE